MTFGRDIATDEPLYHTKSYQGTMTQYTDKVEEYILYHTKSY